MAGHSRPKDGVLSHAYVPAIPIIWQGYARLSEITGTSPVMTALPFLVMPAHSRPKDGVFSHAYVAGIHVFTAWQQRRGWRGQARP